MDNFQTLSVSYPHEHVISVGLNRPKNLNSMSIQFWKEILVCFNEIQNHPTARVVVITGGSCKIFSCGLELSEIKDILTFDSQDPARKSLQFLKAIKAMQNGFTAIEKCKFPVIAAVHGACVGGGVDLISACDIRYCTSDAIFSVKEVDLAIPADMGTLQRLPKITGNHSLVREWCFTGKTFTASDAMNVGLVSRIFESKEKMFEEAMKTAIEIGSKSPVATLGTKHLLNYSRDHTVDEGLNYTALWNSAMIHTEDVTKSIEAAKKKNLPKFSKL